MTPARMLDESRNPFANAKMTANKIKSQSNENTFFGQ
jgi:hypothetical protein